MTRRVFQTSGEKAAARIKAAPSKNSKCPCGSGKKYRKCCKASQPPPRVIAEGMKKILERQNQEREWVERYGHVRPPLSAEFGGKLVFVVGGDINMQAREGPYTFLRAVHDHALHFFGQPMLLAEEAKPLNERHPAIQWMHVYIERIREDPKPSQIGAGAAWFRLAYDLFTIRDNSKLEDILRRRLLDPAKFQSARYELWVAALCITAGFQTEFEDESDNSRTHPEFIAVDKFSPARIAVEAKSRHRKGVQGFRGGKDVPPGAKARRSTSLASFATPANHHRGEPIAAVRSGSGARRHSGNPNTGVTSVMVGSPISYTPPGWTKSGVDPSRPLAVVDNLLVLQNRRRSTFRHLADRP